MRVGRCTPEIFAVVGHRHQNVNRALSNGKRSDTPDEKILVEEDVAISKA